MCPSSPTTRKYVSADIFATSLGSDGTDSEAEEAAFGAQCRGM
jgi:hypothetical protein